MKKLLYPAAVVALLATSAFTAYRPHNTEWQIADGYAIKFTSSDPSGVFKSLKGMVKFHPDHLDASNFDVRIDVNSINTGNGMQNKHAVGEKWFDAAKYPEIAFTSTSVSATPAGYVAKGTLSMHGVSKEFSLPFTFKASPEGGTFMAKFDVNRNDFNIGDPDMKKVPAIMAMEVTVPVTQ